MKSQWDQFNKLVIKDSNKLFIDGVELKGVQGYTFENNTGTMPTIMLRMYINMTQEESSNKDQPSLFNEQLEKI